MNFASLLQNPQQNNRTVFRILATIIAILGLFLALNIIAPAIVSFILNVLWILLIVIVITFFVLGILVVFGMRKEVSRALDILLEGSLTILDFIQLIRELWAEFISTLKEFLVFVAPVFSYIFALILYLLVLMLYKWVGRENDVTYMTVIITFVMIFLVGVMNRPTDVVPDLSGWINRFKKNFQEAFIDGTEVVLFIFFLTMDSSDLFFLPAEYNIPLHAELFGVDLMTRSFVFTDHLQFTTTLIIIAISIEIFRNILRIIAVARKYYVQNYISLSDKSSGSLMGLLKDSIRQSFYELKDDVVRFITFTTVLFFVFMFFPRLKLMTLVIASFSSLVLDIIFVKRLTASKGKDLISRILSKLFNI